MDIGLLGFLASVMGKVVDIVRLLGFLAHSRGWYFGKGIWTYSFQDFWPLLQEAAILQKVLDVGL